MRKFIFMVALFILLFEDSVACSGDCVECHPALVKKNGKMDKDHEILDRCKKCHIDGTKMEIIDKNVSEINASNIRIVKIEGNIAATTSHTECGDDCWKCHDIKKVSLINIAEHKVLQKCIECHVSIDKNFLKRGSSSPSLNNTLEGILKGSE